MSSDTPVWVEFRWHLPDVEFAAPLPSGYLMREARPGEGAAIMAVVAAAYAADPAWAGLTRDIERRIRGRVESLLGRPDAAFIVIEHDGRIVAVSGASLALVSGFNLTTGPCVDAAHQGRGLGTAVLGGSLAWLRDRGLGEAVVWTRKGAIAERYVYPRFGARRTEGVRVSDPPRPTG